MRIFATSDIHGDYETNLKIVSSISNTAYQNDALLVCGDLSHRVSLLCSILKILKAKFKRVFFVPGNHDLWLDQQDTEDSLKKFESLLKIVADCGVETGPCRLKNTVLLPIFGWYDYSFACPEESHKMMWADLIRCKWPIDLQSLTAYFIALNRSIPVTPEDTVITYSHFAPRIDILPRWLLERISSITPFLGSTLIDDQIRKFQSQIHVFGHLHYNFTAQKEGILYINNALGYPHEGRRFNQFLYEIY